MLRIVTRTAIAVLTALGLGAVSVHAASLPFTGTLAIQVGSYDPMVVAGGGVAIANGSSGGSHLNTLAMPASAFETTHQILPVTDPSAAPVNGLQLTVANSTGTITNGTGPIPLVGFAKVCMFGPCSSAVANLNVPLAVAGNGGASFITGSINLTVIGAPWTAATAAIGTITRMGFAHGPASAASTTALPSGQMRLVTPVFVSTNVPSSPVVPTWGILTLHFVPEPTTLVLVSGGLVLLARAGRARLRRH